MEPMWVMWAIAVLAGFPEPPPMEPAMPPRVRPALGQLGCAWLGLGCPGQALLPVADMTVFQETAVDCGPHAAARVLASLGLGQGDRLYRQLQQLRREGLQQDALALQLGTTPDFLATLVGQVTEGRTIAHVQRETDFATLQRRLRAGHPVLALVQTGILGGSVGRSANAGAGSGVDVGLGQSGLVLPELHWIVVTGFDDAAQVVRFRDTNSNREGAIAYRHFLGPTPGGAAPGDADSGTMRASDGAYRWNWGNAEAPTRDGAISPAVSPWAMAVLRQAGTTPRTFLWIEVR
jgi:hypothetical protein